MDKLSRSRSRACLVCGIILPYNTFAAKGCPNDGLDDVETYTSPVFEGVMAMVAPTESWVARWQRIDAFTPGMYATRVQGSLSDEMIDSLRQRGIHYRPRNGSSLD
ncbi:transcription elongation factor complex subunit Spt4 [Schizosaccharomyces japonicus yFS275]|uniref:Transcription elongation factor SPT4 n=1 Tax=Schizosaccharomyces japonicus (strain yFS275 / FY16936) TaxID=402676 RepID=B6JVR7_SCHJY|nr:transcription elongation factor complex subunit Spt4 [Schizosaccharomyces japonicus yFS275]EEB05468.1 transcription elongation factor complex subunit Spt4 [Schizosaccharomyces japonicus yFS275]